MTLIIASAEFRKERKYLDVATDPEEASFPLAYSIVIHSKVGQFERFLRSIYRTQNTYWYSFMLLITM